MSKPTIFFSHSSKDREILLSIKNKMDSITGGVLDIFMSSDGQSIPFGSNWVHKIESNLNKASIMFVFVTPNSIMSNWIYFESGFAYSKGIEVIPVGIGVDISLLRAPLNLLQGFNILSGDGLNNFITVINKKFDYRFEDKFSDNDYLTIVEANNLQYNKIDISQIFDSAEYELLAEYGDGKGGKISYDISEFFSNILSYLKGHSIQFSYDDSYKGSEKKKCIMVLGIKILYTVGKKQDEKGSVRQGEMDKIAFKISPYNFDKSFQLFNHMIRLINDKDWVHLRFRINRQYSYITSQEKISSVMSMLPEEFKFAENHIGGYNYFKKDIKFSIYDTDDWNTREYVLGASYQPKDISSSDIFEFLYVLIDKKVIYKL